VTGVTGTHPLTEQFDISRLDGTDANVCSFTLHDPVAPRRIMI
jgi:hypothetical protein